MNKDTEIKTFLYIIISIFPYLLFLFMFITSWNEDVLHLGGVLSSNILSYIILAITLILLFKRLTSDYLIIWVGLSLYFSVVLILANIFLSSDFKKGNEIILDKIFWFIDSNSGFVPDLFPPGGRFLPGIELIIVIILTILIIYFLVKKLKLNINKIFLFIFSYYFSYCYFIIPKYYSLHPVAVGNLGINIKITNIINSVVFIIFILLFIVNNKKKNKVILSFFFLFFNFVAINFIKLNYIFREDIFLDSSVMSSIIYLIRIYTKYFLIISGLLYFAIFLLIIFFIEKLNIIWKNKDEF